MSGSAPSAVPTWATDAGTTVEPTSGKKAAGWVVEERPPARWFNWWMNLVYQWIYYYGSKNAVGGIFGLDDSTGVAALSTSNTTGTIQGTSTGSDGVGVLGVANTGASAIGVKGTSSSGTGVSGTSTASNGSGVKGVANTGGTAKGVEGSSSSGYGVYGSGAIAGVAGVGASGAYGVYGSSTGSGDAARFVNTGTGKALYAIADNGSSSGAGAYIATNNVDAIALEANNLGAGGICLKLTHGGGTPKFAPIRCAVHTGNPTGDSEVGDMYVASGGVLKICTVAGTGGAATWVSVGTQT